MIFSAHEESKIEAFKKQDNKPKKIKYAAKGYYPVQTRGGQEKYRIEVMGRYISMRNTTEEARELYEKCVDLINDGTYKNEDELYDNRDKIRTK